MEKDNMGNARPLWAAWPFEDVARNICPYSLFASEQCTQPEFHRYWESPLNYENVPVFSWMDTVY